MIRIEIPLPPQPKGRPRFARNGHAYTPKATRDYEDVVTMMARTSTKRPLTGEIRVSMVFFMPIPKSWSKAKKQRAENGELRPGVKPDIDNLAKAVLDGCNGVAYLDDKQIVDLTLSKFYGEPRTVIEMEEL